MGSPFIFGGEHALNLAKAIKNKEQTSVTNPETGFWLLYPKSDGWYSKDSAGTEQKVALGTGGITSLNTLTALTQTFATGTAGSDFGISSSGSTHTFNLPDASLTARGLVTTTGQSYAGTKTFQDGIVSQNNVAFTTGFGIENQGSGATLNIATLNNTSTINLGTSSSTQTINIGTGAGTTTINLGGSGDTVNIAGTLAYVNTTNLQVTDKLITVNKGGAAASEAASGIEVEANSAITAYIQVNGTRNAWSLKAPTTAGVLDLVPGSTSTTLNFSGGTVTVPNGGTLITASSTDTLTNKTMGQRVVDSQVAAISSQTLTYVANKSYYRITSVTSGAPTISTINGGGFDGNIITILNDLGQNNDLTIDVGGNIDTGMQGAGGSLDATARSIVLPDNGSSVTLQYCTMSGTNAVSGWKVISVQAPASASGLGLVNAGDQTYRGIKRFFTGIRSDENMTFATGKGIESQTASGVLNIGSTANTATINIASAASPNPQTVNIGNGGSGATTINIGGAGDSVNILGTAFNASKGLTSVLVTSTVNPAVVGTNYLADTSGGAFTINLPAGSTGAVIGVTDAKETWGTNNLTIDPNGSEKIDGLTNGEELVMNVSGAWIKLHWAGDRWAVEASSPTAGIPALHNGNTLGSNLVLGTNDNFGIDFETNGSIKATLSNGGSLGIGTTTPGSYNSATNRLVVGNHSSAGGITLLSGTTNSAYLAFVDTVGTAIQGAIEYKHASDSMAFRTNDAEQMSISSTGAITLGPSSGGPSVSHIMRVSSTTAGERGLKVQNTNLNTGTGAVELSLWSEEVDGSATPVERVRLVGALDANDTGGKFSIFTRLSGSLIENFSIDRNGTTLIGNTNNTTVAHRIRANTTSEFVTRMTNTSNATPFGMSIDFSAAAPNDATRKFLECSDTGGIRAEFRSNGGLANYSANNVNLSDERMKTDVVSAPAYLEKMLQVQVVNFKYKDQVHDDYNLGVIAQQLNEVAPELVDKDGFGEIPEDGVPLMAVYQTDFQYALLKAIQELHAELQAAKERIATLEGGNQ